MTAFIRLLINANFLRTSSQEVKLSGERCDLGLPLLFGAHIDSGSCVSVHYVHYTPSLYDSKSSLNPCLLVLLCPVQELEGPNTDLKDQSKAFEWVTNSLFSPHQLFPGLRVRLDDKKSLPHLAEEKQNFKCMSALFCLFYWLRNIFFLTFSSWTFEVFTVRLNWNSYKWNNRNIVWIL